MEASCNALLSESHNFFSEMCMESHNFDNLLIIHQWCTKTFVYQPVWSIPWHSYTFSILACVDKTLNFCPSVRNQ